MSPPLKKMSKTLKRWRRQGGERFHFFSSLVHLSHSHLSDFTLMHLFSSSFCFAYYPEQYASCVFRQNDYIFIVRSSLFLSGLRSKWRCLKPQYLSTLQFRLRKVPISLPFSWHRSQLHNHSSKCKKAFIKRDYAFLNFDLGRIQLNHNRHMYTNINLPLTISIHHQKNYYYYYYYYRKYMEINWENLNVDIGD